MLDGGGTAGRQAGHGCCRGVLETQLSHVGGSCALPTIADGLHWLEPVIKLTQPLLLPSQHHRCRCRICRPLRAGVSMRQDVWGTRAMRHICVSPLLCFVSIRELLNINIFAHARITGPL